MATSRPNLVLIVLDTARADALEPYGARTGSSPAIADLASRGTVVRHAFSTANWTLPAHVSMLTGELARNAGLRLGTVGGATDMSWNAAAIDALGARSLATVLGSAGWHPRAASANPWISNEQGFGAGFEEFVSVKGTRRHAAMVAESATGPAPRQRLKAGLHALAATAEAARARADDGAAEILQVVRRWLADGVHAEPFFWFFNLLECHAPYLPPRRFSRLGPLGRIDTARDHIRFGSLDAIGRANCGDLEVPQSVVRRMRRAYEGAVRSADGWVAAFLEELDQHGVLEDTLVVVTSDHGENLGESGRTGHALWLDDRLVRVPLIAAGPGAFDPDSVTSLASLPRIAATALGVHDHPWVTDVAPAGIAVAQSDPVARRSDPLLQTAAAAHHLDEYAMWRMTTASTCATDGELKLVREGHDDWLYDLTTDPGEVAPARVDARSILALGDRVARLRAAVETAAPRADGDQDRAGVATTSTPMHDDPELTARMRMLGYL